MFPKSNFLTLALTIALCTVCSVRAHATTYYACVSNSTGSIVIVSSTHTCSSTQHKISWNQTGPTGPQGPPGISRGLAAFSPSHPSIGTPTVVVRTHTAAVAAYFYVTATALLSIDRSDSGAFCYISKNGLPNNGNFGGSDLAGHFQQAVITDYYLLIPTDYLELICYSGSRDFSTYVYDAGITAIAIAGASNNGVVEKAVPNPNHMLGLKPNSN